MLINIVLLILVFGAKKKKISPYIAASLLGVIKGGLYLVFSQNIALAVIMGGIYGGLATVFVYFLTRLDQREDRERPAIPTYKSAGSQTASFKWEYIPLVVVLVLIIGGEMFLTLMKPIGS